MLDRGKRTKADVQHIAEDWIDAWNAHDLDRISHHYAENVVFEANTVMARWNREDGRLAGRAEVREQFRKGLELAPDLHFTLEEVFLAPSGYAVLYRRENGNRVIDSVVLDEQGLAVHVTAFYSAAQR
jgi:ketosteroid isomerase-like protein